LKVSRNLALEIQIPLHPVFNEIFEAGKIVNP
jgi:hypothetical protein